MLSEMAFVFKVNRQGSEMEKTKTIMTSVLATVIVFCVCGCQDSGQKKQAMVEKWKLNKSAANIPVAKSLMDSGEYKQAKELLDKCLADEPDLYSAHLLMGQIYFNEDRIDKAQISFNKTVELNDQCDQGWYWLGEVSSVKGGFEDAANYYSRAMEIVPSDSKYIVSLASAYAQMRDYEKAITLLDRKIKAFSGDVSLVKAKADILTRCGRKDEVVKVYEKAVLLNGDSLELIETLGYCYLMEQNWAGAKDMFERLVNEGDAGKRNEYLGILSTCCMNTEEYDVALGYFDKMDSDFKDEPEFWINSGQAALGSGQGRRVIFCANRALFLKPGWPDATVLLGCGQYLNGDYEKSLKTFSKVSGDTKNSSLVRMMVGKCREKLGLAEVSGTSPKGSAAKTDAVRVSSLAGVQFE